MIVETGIVTKIEESTATTLSGNPAHKFIISIPSANRKFMSVTTIKDGVKYNVVFESSTSNFETFKSTAEKMINSFEILG